MSRNPQRDGITQHQGKPNMKTIFAAAIVAMTPAFASAQTFPGAETVGFAQECFVPITSKKDPAKILYWNIAVSCTADRARPNGAAEIAEALAREEAAALAASL
jgi:hypothetical protein